MPWSRTPDREWWLRHGDLTRNVEDMRADPRSALSFTRELLAFRRSAEEFRRGAYATLEAGPGVWAWRRGEGSIVAVNLSERRRVVPHVDGTIRLDTRLGRAGEGIAGRLALDPWEGVILLPN
jgi:glycosidase